MDIILFIAMFVVLIAALGPHHRRTFSLPRAPFGADAGVDRDLDRVLHDVPATERTEHSAGPSADRDRPAGLHVLRLH